jgi:hypothetical protein
VSGLSSLEPIILYFQGKADEKAGDKKSVDEGVSF